MLAALATSVLFLTSYVIYHANVGSRPFTGTGPIRVVYFAILISHVLLAIAIVPLVLITVSRALARRFDTPPPHRPHHLAAVDVRVGDRGDRVRDAVSDELNIQSSKFRIQNVARGEHRA